jgi:hypothetical protein
MRPMFIASAGVSLLLIVSGTGWAGARSKTTKSSQSAPSADSGKEKETPPAFNKTFEWEDKVVGPKDKGVDHDKIAAQQEQGRREEAARKRDEASGRTKKAARPEGVNGPATATLPTMDIEKAAPAGSVHPMRRASYTPPRQHDAIDNVLAENGVGSDGPSSSGLDGVIGRPNKHHRAAARHAKRHARR